jgi:hypothetical protein
MLWAFPQLAAGAVVGGEDAAADPGDDSLLSAGAPFFPAGHTGNTPENDFHNRGGPGYVDVLHALQKTIGGSLDSAEGGLFAFSLICTLYVLLLAFGIWLVRRAFAGWSKQDHGRRPAITKRKAAQPGE